MLLLKRKVDEVVVIRTPGGDVIEVMVCEARRDHVRLGVRADPATEIWRKEMGEFTRGKSRDERARVI